MEYIINSKQNRLYKLAKSLKVRKYREKNRMYILEGMKQILHGVKMGLSPKYLFVKMSKYDFLLQQEGFSNLKSDLYMMSDELFDEVSDTEHSQGIIALFEISENPLLPASSDCLILDQIQDPGNMGSIIRNADAFGITDIYLLKGCVDVYSQKVVRAAMGSLFNVNVHAPMELEELVEEIKSRGNTILLSDLSAQSMLHEFEFKNRERGYAVVLGNEGKGISPKWYEYKYESIKIAMFGSAQSLNVAMASAILMYELYLNKIGK